MTEHEKALRQSPELITMPQTETNDKWMQQQQQVYTVEQ